jgi:hypothetical protein
MSTLKKITLDGTDYVRADDAVAKPIPGKRAVIVVDRGWIVAGDVTQEPGVAGAPGRIKLSRALHVFKFESVGFGGMIQNPKVKTDLRPLPNGFDIPADSEIFRVWVDDNWGL